MSIANYLVNLTDGLTSQGVLGSSKGGTGLTTVGSSGQAIVSDGTNWVSQTVASGAPKVSQISYTGDNTAANPTGGETVTLTGTGFAAGARVLINQTQVGVVTVVSATQITFTTPALATGSYVLYVVNTDGGTAVVVPGIQYSGVPSWTTAAGTLGTVYETAAISSTVAATSDSAVSYSVISGALPTGATLASNGTISGTSPVTASSTTYTFTVRANDAENQETDRTFNLTISPDTVTWSSPANAATLVATPGVAYSSALSAASAAGQTVSYSANALPAGLAISGSTITGTPTTAGTSSSTLTATSAVTNRSAQVTISWTITVAADAYFPYTTLLLNSETVAVPFAADASANNFAVTAVGDARPSNFNPYTPGYYSNYFDGSGDYLSIPTGAAAAFGTTGTVEFWYYPTTSPAIARIINNGTTPAAGVMDVYDSSSAIGFGNAGYTTTTVKLNTWTHIACVINAGVLKIYFNGVSQPLAGATTGYNLTATADVWVGGINGYTQWTSGYISNLRFVKGTAVYTSDFIPSTTPLTAITNTSLLTCQSNRFVDNSANAFAVTKAGDTKVSSFVPFAPNSSYSTYGSTYFDGTGDALTVPYNSAINITTGDFTVETWCYPTTTTSGVDSLWGYGVYGTMLYHAGTAWSWEVGDGGGNYFTISGTAPLNAWSHIACTRSGSTFTLWINGVSAGTNTTAGALASSRALNIGVNITGGTQNFTGYINNFRVVKGTAVYTAAFTPPTTPLTAVTNTALLTCQTNQPINNQTFLDNSTSAFPVTRTGNATQGSFSPYGANWSNYFDGTGDYLDTDTYAAFGFGTGDFTLETWACPTSSSANQFIYGGRTNNTLFLRFGQNAGTVFQGLQVGRVGISNDTFTAYTFTLNQWYHLAISRQSGTMKVFVNGVQINSFSNTFDYGASGYARIGASESATEPFSGYLSNFRIVKGTALYTTAFTPSTTPLTAITGTSLLTCQSPNLVDNSLSAFTLTKAGDVSVQKFNPFATVTQTPQTYSTYFDGTSSFATPVSAEFTFGTGAFTIEAWVNPSVNAATVTQWIYGNITTNTGNTQAGLTIKTNGTLQLQTWNAALATTTAVIPLNTWTHVAASFDGTTYRLFVNGVLSATGTTVYALGANGPGTIGHNGTLGGNSLFTGYISNARVVKGTAVYTANFTPATTPLTAVNGTVLLTCQDTTIRDNSVNQFTLTVNVSPQPRRQNPFGSTTSSAQDYSTATFGGSAYFDGSGDYLTCTGAISITGAFTAQGWFYNTSTSGQQQSLFSFNSASGNGYGALRADCDQGNVQYNFSVSIGTSGSSWASNISTNNAYVKNIWNHFAVTRDSANLVKIFINGVQIASGTQAGALYSTSTTHAIGCNNLPGAVTNPFIGYISDLQLVNGTALYTANFVPPQAPLTAVTNTTLLLSGDKAAIADKSGKINLECVGDTKLGVEQPFAGSYYSNYFDGTGDYLSTANNVATNLGTGDFTVEFWLNANVTQAGSNPRILSNDTWNTSAGFDINIESSLLQFRSGGGTGKSCTFTTTDYGIWQHIAFTRSGTSFKVFKNGVLANTYTDSSNLTSANPTYIGKYAAATGSDFTGYISNLRIVKGTAVYTTAFTPSTQPLTAIANTQLLSCQSNRFVDNSTNAFAVIKTGDAAVKTFNPWQRNSGGSMYFDGTGDRLSTSPGVINSLGSGDFTIEGWVYPSSLSSMRILSQGTSTTGEFLFILNSNGSADFCETTTSKLAFSAGSFVVGEWKHFAIVRSGSGSNNLKGYINGTLAGTGTSSSYNFSATTAIFVGSNPATASQDFQGYIDDFRITKGVARYTTNFTAPTTLLTK